MKSLIVATWLVAATAANAQPIYDGFLCCNLRADFSGWITDINYQEAGKRVVPVGTPVKLLGYGRYRVTLETSVQKLSLGNDYSRELSLGRFAERYVVKSDPRVNLASFPVKTQHAIQTMRVSKGMTKEQVLMAVGYPVTSENPSLDAPVWRYWLTKFAPFTIVWDAQGLVKEIVTDAQTRLVIED